MPMTTPTPYDPELFRRFRVNEYGWERPSCPDQLHAAYDYMIVFKPNMTACWNAFVAAEKAKCCIKAGSRVGKSEAQEATAKIWQSDTPRTDAQPECLFPNYGSFAVSADFARTLERENAELVAVLRQILTRCGEDYDERAPFESIEEIARAALAAHELGARKKLATQQTKKAPHV